VVSLFTSLLNSSNAIQVYTRQLGTIQNNVANANTPGYVRQTQTLDALPFNPAEGLPGGVAAGAIISARSEYAEQNVRTQVSHLGLAQQQAGDLSRIGPLFDLTSDTGVSGSIGKFFQSFSRLSVNPNDNVARQSVLDTAQQLADSFHQTASGLADAGGRADSQIRETVTSINQLVGQLRGFNATYRQEYDSGSDAGLDASVHTTLEKLAELADISVSRETDGSYSVYLGGQTALVLGDHQFPLAADFSSPQTAVLDFLGANITSQVHSGTLAAALQEKNKLIPSYTADLDTLAAELAKQVNDQLALGVDKNGQPPAAALFTYNPAPGTAASFQVGPITSDQIAAATSAAPGGNGNALNVADMLTAKSIGGVTFTAYLGQLGARIGSDIANANTATTTQQGLVNQARTLRDQVSGISLDEEAATILVVQRAYQASGKMITVLNTIMDSLMEIVR
jgi:flagellar hook-associated protein 1 FlgK